MKKKAEIKFDFMGEYEYEFTVLINKSGENELH